MPQHNHGTHGPPGGYIARLRQLWLALKARGSPNGYVSMYHRSTLTTYVATLALMAAI